MQSFDLELILKIPQVDSTYGYDLSPSGERVAYSWNKTGQWEIYELLLGEPASPRQITSGPGAKFSPCYSPDGKSLAYMLDLDGSESFCINIYDLNKETNSPIHLHPSTALQPSMSWSPGGDQIALISDQDGCFNTYIHSLGTGQQRCVLNLPHPDSSVKWSPDGKRLAITVEMRGQEHGVYILDLDTGSIQPLADGHDPINARDMCWFPDSRRLAFCSDVHGWYDIAILNVELRQIQWLTHGEEDNTSPACSPDGNRIVYIHSMGETSSLAIINLDDGTPTCYQIEPGVHSSPKFTPDGDRILFIFDNPSHPQDLWSFSIQTGTFHHLTHSLPPDLHVEFHLPGTIKYPSLDGEEVPALLFSPQPQESLPPAVILIHGGPDWHCQQAWEPIIQIMVNQGWLVLAPNYRGSTGYGKRWQLANQFDMGGGDSQDIAAGALYLIQQGLADPNCIAVTGRSHGGYLTMTALTQFPDLWVGGSAVAPFLNWFTSHENARHDVINWELENFGDPRQHYDLWYERSPFFFLDQVQAPVQLICGVNDRRCPASESNAAYQEMQALGKIVDLVQYPDEGHTFLNLYNIIDAEQRRIAFLDKLFSQPPG